MLKNKRYIIFLFIIISNICNAQFYNSINNPKYQMTITPYVGYAITKKSEIGLQFEYENKTKSYCIEPCFTYLIMSYDKLE